MRTRCFPALASLVLGAVLSSGANASTFTTLGVVDFIDASFGPGGGSYTKSLTSAADDGWSVFAANAGDSLTVSFSATVGTSNAPAAYDGAVLLEMTDGVVAVGDAVNVTDFSMNRFGLGTDLVIQHSGFSTSPPGSYQFSAAQSQSVSFIAAASGQYAIGVACNNDTCVPGSTFTVQLTGNTGTLTAASEPATLVLLAAGLGLAGASRRRR